MPRRVAEVSINKAITTRRDGRQRPHVVRWSVRGVRYSEAFETLGAARAFQQSLVQNKEAGKPFGSDGRPGEPTGTNEPFHEFARDYIASRQPEWSIRTLRSAIEALARAIPHAVSSDRAVPPPATQAYLRAYLDPNRENPKNAAIDRWLKRHVVSLAKFDRAVASHVHDQLALRPAARTESSGAKRKPATYAPNTVNRYRTSTRGVLREAVRRGRLINDPWPLPRGVKPVSQRQLNTRRLRSLPSMDDVQNVLAAIPTHQPGSRGYQLLSAVCLYAGLRPSEALRLKPSDFKLPDEPGWGELTVERADDGAGGVKETKTGHSRTIAIHPDLVERVRAWLDGHQGTWLVEAAPRPGPGQPAEVRVPTLSNWRRAVVRACATAGVSPTLRVYDFRHVCASAMLAKGVPAAKVAAQLGNSVEILHRTYEHVLEGEDPRIRELLDDAFGRPVAQGLVGGR